MFKKSGNSTVKIIAATSMVAFTLIASFSAALAWFAGMRNNIEQGDGYNTKPISGQLDTLTIHELVEDDEYIYNSTTHTIDGYNFNPTPASTIAMNWQTGIPDYDNKTPSLGKYSLLQKTNPLLLVFKLTRAYEANTVKIVSTTSETYTGNDYESKASASGNPLSWVVQYSSKVLTSETIANSDFTIMTDSLSTEDHFADIGNDGTFNSFTQTKTFYQGSDTTKITYVLVMLDYYANAMEYFYMMNLGKSFINDIENDVPFNVDWTMVI